MPSPTSGWKPVWARAPEVARVDRMAQMPLVVLWAAMIFGVTGWLLLQMEAQTVKADWFFGRHGAVAGAV